MDENEQVPQPDAMEEEVKLLTLLKTHPHRKNPLKLKKLLMRIYDDYCETIQIGIMQNIIMSPEPVKTLNHILAQFVDFPVVIREIVESGKHGMIIIKDDVFPVDLRCQPHWLKEDFVWLLEDEIEIQHKLVDMWRKEHNGRRFHGKVVLFKPFGFSGIPREIRKGFPDQEQAA